MSEYGLKIRGDRGQILCDTVMPSYVCVEQGSGTIAETGRSTVSSLPVYGHTVPEANIESDEPDPLYAYLIPDGVICSIYRNRLTSDTNGWMFNYAIFRQAKYVPRSNMDYGLRCYDEKGNLTFDAGHKTFTVVSNTLISWGQTGAITPGKYIIAGMPFNTGFVGGSDAQYFTAGIKLNNGNVTLHNVRNQVLTNRGIKGEMYSTGPASVICIDIV